MTLADTMIERVARSPLKERPWFQRILLRHGKPFDHSACGRSSATTVREPSANSALTNLDQLYYWKPMLEIRFPNRI